MLLVLNSKKFNQRGGLEVRSYILKHKLLALCSLLLVIGMAIIEAYQAILFKTIVDTATGTYNLSITTLIGYAILFLIAVFISEALSKTSNAALNAAVMKDYKQSIIDGFLNIDKQSKLTSSELISILNNDTKVIEESYLSSLISMSKDIFLFVISLVLLLRINVYLTIAILIFGWLPVLVPQLFTKRSQLLKGKYLENLERHVNQIKEIAQGFEVIKGFNIEKKFSNRFSKVNAETEHSKFKSESFMGFQGALSLLSGFSMFFINLLIASYFVMQGDITVGSMIAAVQLMNYIVNPLISISKYITRMKSVSKTVANIEEKILNNKSKYSQGTNTLTFDDRIEIKGLTYSYDNRDQVICNIDYVFEKGKKYAIVGESGCGKTTLLKILMHQIKDYQGDVTIDGVSISTFDPHSYYKKVTLIQQTVFMFKETLKNNICLFNDFTDEKLNQAVNQAGLTKTIQFHQAGLETLVGEGNVELSGGELKRVSIARGLIRDAEILLVDEATSALDKITACEIEKTLMQLDATIIAITHEMDESVLSHYDEVLVMKDGKIVESGNLQKLLKDKGYFYALYHRKISNSEMVTSFAIGAPSFT